MPARLSVRPPCFQCRSVCPPTVARPPSSLLRCVALDLSSLNWKVSSRIVRWLVVMVMAVAASSSGERKLHLRNEDLGWGVLVMEVGGCVAKASGRFVRRQPAACGGGGGGGRREGSVFEIHCYLGGVCVRGIQGVKCLPPSLPTPFPPLSLSFLFEVWALNCCYLKFIVIDSIATLLRFSRD